ncbi:unnamed protein product [Caenorhabditis brenneri]
MDNFGLRSESTKEPTTPEAGPSTSSAGIQPQDWDMKIVEDDPDASQTAAAKKQAILTKFLEVMGRSLDEKKEVLKTVLSKMLEGVSSEKSGINIGVSTEEPNTFEAGSLTDPEVVEDGSDASQTAAARRQ